MIVDPLWRAWASDQMPEVAGMVRNVESHWKLETQIGSFEIYHHPDQYMVLLAPGYGVDRVRRRLHIRADGLLAPVLYLLITLILTWPLAMHMGTHVIGPFYGDNLEYVWKIWWVKHAWFELHVSPEIVPNINWPSGYFLAYGELTPLHTILMLPVNLVLGEVWTYNLAILLSTWLSGWFAYRWLLDLTGGRRGAAFVGGLIFAFCPYRMARIAGNLPLVSTEGIPIALWGIERFWQRHSWKDGLLIALGVSVSALSTWYYALALALLVPLYWLVRAGPWRAWITRQWFWIGVGLASLVAICAVSPFMLPYVNVFRTGLARVPLKEADFWSASVIDFFLPNWRHPLWGMAVRRVFQASADLLPYEFLLSLGYVVGTLALFGWRRGKHPARRALVAWTLVALILSLGPSLHLLPGWPLRLPVPSVWSNGFTTMLNWVGQHSLAREAFTLNNKDSVVIPLPALLIRWFLFAGTGVRSWGRFAFFATTGMAALAALGLCAAEEESEQGGPSLWHRRLLTVVAGLLVLFEFYTGPQALTPIGPRPVDKWLAQQSGEFAIVQLPLKVALSGPQMFYTRYHGKNIIGGYGTYLPILFEERYPELASFPSDASVECLEQWPVRYVLVDQADLPAYPGLSEAIARQPRLAKVITAGTIDVYAIVANK